MIKYFFLCTLLFFSVCFTLDNSSVSIKAQRFEVNLSLNYFEANENIIIEQGDITIYADKANYKESKNKINLFDNIITEYKDVKIYCQEMVFDREKNIINAYQQVRVVNKDYTVYGKKLIYYIDKEIMKFEGETIVHQDKNVLKSFDIILDILKSKIYSNNDTSFIISGDK